MSLQFDEQLISVAEAAKLLQVSQSTLWRWIDSGKLPAYRIGLRRIRLKRADLQQLVSPARPENSGATASTQPQTGRRLSELEKRLPALEAGREIVAYCRGPWCVMSFEAVAELRKRGFNARRLEDGLPEWQAAGLEVEATA